MAFPRQENWGWLPFPSPGHLPNPGVKPMSPALTGEFSTTEPLGSHCAMLCLVAQLCPTLCDPMHCSPPGSSVHGDSPGKNTGVSGHALLQGDLPNPEIKPRSPALQVDFFTI